MLGAWPPFILRPCEATLTTVPCSQTRGLQFREGPGLLHDYTASWEGAQAPL